MSEKNKEKKAPGRTKKIVLTVLLCLLIVLLVLAAVFGYRYRSHIKAAVIWLTTPKEKIQENVEKAKEERVEVLNNNGFNASKELEDALMSGVITHEEHTQILVGSITLEEVLERKNANTQTAPPENEVIPENTQTADDTQNNGSQTSDTSQTLPPSENVTDEQKAPAQNDTKTDDGKPKTDNTPQQKPPQQTEKPKDDKNNQQSPTPTTQQASDVDKRIAELVTRMYVLKSEYTSSIEGVVSSMKADFAKLPPEQRTKSAKQSIATGYMSKINAMEAQCDAQVDAVVAELRQLLKSNGRDMSLADAIVSTYAKEKDNTKAYYLSTYGD